MILQIVSSPPPFFSSFLFPFFSGFLFLLVFGKGSSSKNEKMFKNKTICSHIAELFSAAGENFGYLKCELHSRTPLVAITKFECSIFSLLTPNFGLPGKTSANAFSRDRFFWRFAPRFFFWYPGWYFWYPPAPALADRADLCDRADRAARCERAK